MRGEMQFKTSPAYPLIAVALVVATFAVVMGAFKPAVMTQAGPPSICDEFRSMSKAAQSRAVELKKYCEGK